MKLKLFHERIFIRFRIEGTFINGGYEPNCMKQHSQHLLPCSLLNALSQLGLKRILKYSSLCYKVEDTKTSTLFKLNPKRLD